MVHDRGVVSGGRLADQDEHVEVTLPRPAGPPGAEREPAQRQQHDHGGAAERQGVREGGRGFAYRGVAGQAADAEQAEEALMYMALGQDQVVHRESGGDDERHHESLPRQDRYGWSTVGPPCP